MSDLLNKVRQTHVETLVLDYANSYLAVLKAGSNNDLAKLLQEAQDNELFKKTIIAFNRPLALMIVEQGVNIDVDDADTLFTLTLNYPETSQAILEVLQPAENNR